MLNLLASSRPKAGQNRGQPLKTLSHCLSPPAETLSSQTTEFHFPPCWVMFSKILNLSVSHQGGLQALDSVMKFNFTLHSAHAKASG